MAINRKEPTDLTDSKWLETDQYFKASNVVNTTDEGEHLELEEGEDYRDYTEADANNRFTVEKNKITVSGLQRNDTGHYIYKDMGTDFFDGDFEHLVHVKPTAHTNGGVVAFWGMSNTVNTWNNIRAANGHTFELSFFRAGDADFKLNLIEMVNGTRYENPTTYTIDTDYYLKIVRDESIGTYGRLYCYIYSDEARTTLVHTLQLDLHAKIDFRYIWAVNNWADGKSGSMSAEIGERNIELFYDEGYRTSNPISIDAIKKVKSSNIKWTSTEPTDTDLKIYTAVSSSNTIEPNTEEQQTLYLGGATGGTFTLGDGTTNTSALAYDASASTIQTALEGIYGSGLVSVVADTDFTITFDISIGDSNLEASFTNLTGATDPTLTVSDAVDYKKATSNSTIPGISTNQDLTGKYLWVRQELSTEDADATPRLSTLEVLIETAKKSLAFFKFF